MGSEVTAQRGSASGPRLPTELAFAAASVTFVLTFASSGAPAALFNTYRSENGVSDADLTTAFAAYVVGAGIALLVGGRLSDHLGRKPVVLIGLALALTGCALLVVVTSPRDLIGARTVQGLASGLISSALGAWVVDFGSLRHPRIATAVTGVGATLGLAVGAIGAGVLVQFAPFPRQLPFAIIGSLLVVCAVLMTIAPETSERSPGTLASLRPRLAVPRESVRPLVPAAAVFASTWAIGGFYQAVGPSVAAEILHTHGAVASAFVVASLLGASALGALLSNLVPAGIGQRAGMVVLVAALIFVVVALAKDWLSIFFVASIVAGIGWGVAYTASVRLLITPIAVRERAGLLSVVYLVSYAGAALPGLVAGQLTRVLSLQALATGYLLLTGVGLAVMFATFTRRTRAELDLSHENGGVQ